MLLARNVGEGYDNAFDSLAFAAIGQETAKIPDAASNFDFPLDRIKRPQHFPGIAHQRLVGGQRTKSPERTADIAICHIEALPGRGRKKPDVKVDIEKDGRNVGAVQDFLQIARGHALQVRSFQGPAVTIGMPFAFDGMRVASAFGPQHCYGIETQSRGRC